MFGLLVYWCVSIGLAGYGRRMLGGESPSWGLAAAFGAAIPVVLFPGLHLVVGLPLTLAAYATAVVAVPGWGLVIADLRREGNWRAFLLHPVVVLPALAAAVLSIRGPDGLKYLPYLGDEFTNWIGASAEIFIRGEFGAIRQDIYLNGYTPGWRLWLAFPWFLSGTIDLGASATAPLVLHAAALGALFDVIRRETERAPAATRAWVAVTSWAILSVMLLGEVVGRLWTYNLLVEQPQAYLSVMFLAFFAVADGEDDRTELRLMVLASSIAVACYLVKSAGLVLALAGLAALLLQRACSGRLVARRTLILSAVLIAPVLIVHAAWSAGVKPDNCLYAPLSGLRGDLGNREGLAIWDVLAVRLVQQVGEYLAVYKLPLTIAAAAGWIYGIASRRWRTFLVLALFTVAYFGALYAYHLVCLGPGYFIELNSIPRFTRVPLQMFHSFGLAMLLCWIATAVLRRLGPPQGMNVLRSGLVVACVAATCAVLASQIRLIDQTRREITDRTVQRIDPRVPDTYALVAAVEEHFPEAPSRPIRAIIVDQRGDSSLQAYLHFFSLRKAGDKVVRSVLPVLPFAWGVPPGDDGDASGRIVGPFRQALESADIVWPFRIDAWQAKVLQAYATPNCPLAGATHYLRRAPNGQPKVFLCEAKPAPGRWELERFVEKGR